MQNSNASKSPLNIQQIASIADSITAFPDLEKYEIGEPTASKTALNKIGQFDTWEKLGMTFGFSKISIEKETAAEAFEDIYAELLALTQGAHIYRFWNFLPELNKGSGDSERYKQFCTGRSNAFSKSYGNDDIRHMPAGTCVGCDGNEFSLYFIAGITAPEHYENPKQVPAYRYPRQYGPRSPSFARATSVQVDNRHYHFISGTAAVIGHESVGLNNFQQQLEVTCDNLDIMIQQVNALEPQGSGKVYLRNQGDFEKAKTYLNLRFPDISQKLSYIKADICREELLVEIEFSLSTTE
jgi:chorismate lyase / 3-hydroxybenzoate synthase